MNIAAVAEHLGIHPQTAYTYAQNGVIPGFRLGAGPRPRWRFYLSAIDAAMTDSSDPWALPSKKR